MPKHRKILRSLAMVTVGFYLAFHALQGNQGVYALVVKSGQRDYLEKQLAEAKEQRRKLEHRVALLRAESLDPDLLDEQARRNLGYAAPDEIVLAPETKR